MSEINVSKTLHIEAAAHDKPVYVGGVGYVSIDRNVLMESVSTEGRAFVRRSEDNGRSWQDVEEWDSGGDLEDDLILVRGLPRVFCDPDDGRLLRVFSASLDKRGVIGWDYEHAPGQRTGKNFIEVSADEGRTWSAPDQVIMRGNDYDEEHWAQDVWYGKNCAVIAGGPLIKRRDGCVIAPWCGPRLYKNGDIINPNADKETANPDGAVQWRSGCFFGRWRTDGSGLDWSEGEPVTLPLKYSCDGGDEPGMDYLPDGRLFVVLRARTYPHTLQELPSLHYYALSSDDGRTWAQPQPLLYDDGSYAYSPACFANVVRLSKNGRFYVMTNFADAPCTNCDPRNQLYIGEIDTHSLRLKKDTMTIIEQQDRAAGQPDGIRFSNFCWYEDRQTRNLVLLLTASPGNVGWSEGCNVPPHAYRYDVELPG